MTDPDELASPSGSGSTASDRLGGKLFLGGLSWDTSEDKLRDHFGKYGELLEVVVMRDKVTAKPRGFGFVTFRDAKVVDRVVQDIHYVDGRQIDAKKSVPQEQKPKARKVFVGGLSPETTEHEFHEYFSQFGNVAEVQIMQDHMTGRSRGFGFITFEEDSSAERVFAAGAMHSLSGKQVEVKPATPKGSGAQRPGPRPPRGEYGGVGLLPFAGGLPGAPPYSVAPYSMYGGYGGRGGLMPGPYGAAPGYQQYPGVAYQGIPQYPQYPQYQGVPILPQMPQQQMQGYLAPFTPYGPAMGYTEPGRQRGGPSGGGSGGGIASTPIPFHRQQPPGLGGAPAPQDLSPPYQPRQRGSGRGAGKVEVPQVDSASSLELGAEQMKKLSLSPGSLE